VANLFSITPRKLLDLIPESVEIEEISVSHISLLLNLYCMKEMFDIFRRYEIEIDVPRAVAMFEPVRDEPRRDMVQRRLEPFFDNVHNAENADEDFELPY